MDANMKIFDHLTSKGVEVHFPGIKSGKCEAPYVVIKDMGQTGNSYNGSKIIHMLIYTPQVSYITMINLRDQIKMFMDELSYIKTGSETPVIIEDDIKAFSSSIEYQVFKKN